MGAFRVGYYPFETKAAGKARRLNVALDGRFYSISDASATEYGTFSQFALTVGYDRF
jgi:hypothetical protein